MKKILFVAIMALVSVAASAQVYVGGGLGAAFSTRSFKGDAKSTNAVAFSLSPEVGYYITDKFAVGAQLSLGLSKSKGFDANFTTAETAYARYDFVESGVFKLGAELALGYTTLGKDNGGAFTSAIRPVAQLAVSDKVSVVTRFELVSFRMFNDNAGGGNSFGLGILNGSSFAEVGVAYKF